MPRESDGAAAGLSPTVAELEHYAHATWECVLQAVLSPSRDVELAMPCEGASVHELLQEASLLQPAPARAAAAAAADGGSDDDDDGGSGGGSRLIKTRDALRFVLAPTHAQVWKLVRAYMELAERGTRGTRKRFLSSFPELGHNFRETFAEKTCGSVPQLSFNFRES